MKEKFDFVMVVLVYRNTDDLEELIESVQQQMTNYRIVIVNSFYDDESERKARQIAENYDCDFMSVENKGYSFGNNVGIEYATDHYDYEYVIVSNPDIIVRNIPRNTADLHGDIIAPKIIAADGRPQNPMIVKENKVSEWLVYKGFKNKNRLLVMAGIGINKIFRTIFIRLHKNQTTYPIFTAHGSFLFLSKNAIEKLGSRPYDENIFLFAEESVLAVKAKREGLMTLYNADIFVNHKEDGSMKLGNISVNNELSKANIYFYETYRKQG